MSHCHSEHVYRTPGIQGDLRKLCIGRLAARRCFRNKFCILKIRKFGYTFRTSGIAGGPHAFCKV